MGLDARGIIAVVEIVIYIPILLLGLLLSLRHGFARKAGWISLVILALSESACLLYHGSLQLIFPSTNSPSDWRRRAYSLREQPQQLD